MLAAALLVAAGVTPLVIGVVDGPPALETGSVPEGYDLDVVGEGDSVDLATVGMARLGGTVDSDVARVQVELSGQSADALIDRSVDPAVWWLNTSAPATGTYEFDITAVGTNGRLSNDSIEVDFVFPTPDDVVISQESLVLGAKDAPKLKAYDEATGEVMLSGVKRGQVREGVILASEGVEAAPQGLLRMVQTTGSAGGDVTVTTSQARIDEAIFQAKLPVEPQVGGNSFPRAESWKKSFDIELGLKGGTKPEGGVKALRDAVTAQEKAKKAKKRQKSTPPAKVDLGKGYFLRVGATAGASAELKMELVYTKVLIKRIPTRLKYLEVTADLHGTLAAELGSEAPTNMVPPNVATLGDLLKGKAKEVKKEKEIFSYDTPSVKFLVGGVFPVMVNGSLEIKAFANAKLAPKSVLAAATGFTLGGTAHLTPSSSSMKPINEADFKPEYALGIAGSADAGVKFESGVELYGTLGAMIVTSAKVDGSFSGTVIDSADDRGPGIDASVALKLGVAAQAQLELLEFYKREWDTEPIEKTLASCSVTFYPVVGPATASCSKIGDDPSPGSGPTSSGGPAVTPASTGSADVLNSIIVMDTSGSMSETDGSGVVRIEGARRAVADYLETVDSNAKVGLRSYPAGTGCGAGQLLIPPQRVDRGAINDQVAQLEPDGQTPTHIALEAALDDLPDSGFRTIILVSDGEGNCGGEDGASCEVARRVASSGVELTFNTVGFQISDAGEQELRCISEATKGSYKTVDDGEELAEELNALTEPRLTVTMAVPDEIQMDSAGTPTEPVEVSAVVNNVGGRDAKGVSLSLAQEGGSGVEIPDAGKLIGNIRAGERRSATWTVDPVAADEGFTSTWTAAAVATGVEPSEDVGESNVVVPSTALGDEAGPVLKGVSRVAILGDGGVVGADSDSDCEPPTEIIGRLGADDLFSDTQVLACAGASTVQIGSGADSQLDELASRQGSTPFDAALISLGSTDGGLPAMLDRCAAGDCDAPALDCEGKACQPIEGTGYEQRLRGLQRSAMSVLAKTDAALGSRGAPIILTAYPKIFPDQGRSRESCLGEGTAGIEEFNARTERLNDTLAQIARSASDAGLPVRFMPSSEAMLAGTVNEEGVRTPGRTACERRAVVALGEEGKPPAPTPEAGFGGLLTRALLADSGGWSEIRSAERGSVRPADATDSSAAGGQVRDLRLEGFAPDSTVEVMVGDPGVYVGSLQADEGGKVKGELVVPEWSGNGDQPVRGLGVGSDDNAVVASGSIDISDGQPWGWLRWVLPVLSIALFAAAGWFALRSRPAKAHARAFDAATVAAS